jgi:hypothetical protein
MLEIESAWVSAAATAFAGVATTAAAVTTFLAYRLQRSLARSRKQLLKGDILLRNIQSLIATFADIHATAKQDGAIERAEKLRELAENIRYTVTVIKSLHPGIGKEVEEWRTSSDYILAGHGAIIGDKYDQFLFSKAEGLRKIQDQVFEEINA